MLALESQSLPPRRRLHDPAFAVVTVVMLRHTEAAMAADERACRASTRFLSLALTKRPEC
jgi:hypothetical protein